MTCLTSGPRPALVSGSREGVITSWAVDSGTALQTIDITQVQPSALQKRLPAKGSACTPVLSERVTCCPPGLTHRTTVSVLGH